MNGTLHRGDCRDVLPMLDAGSVQCVVTSPPYLGLRDYEMATQIGREALPDCLGWATGRPCGACFVCVLVGVFRQVRRALRADGVCWLNLGDSYAGGGRGGSSKAWRTDAKAVSDAQRKHCPRNRARTVPGLQDKDLMGMPWRVALALQADGWCLRQDVIWSKPNPMPESVVDRCTKSHEYLFLLSKSGTYYFDQDAIAEPIAAASVARMAQDVERQAGSTRAHGGTRADRPMRTVGGDDGTRNRRSVWSIATRPFAGAHFAVMPEALAHPCILAGSRPGDLVLDPFMGAGTTAVVAERLGRRWVGCELNPGYSDLALDRVRATQSGLALT